MSTETAHILTKSFKPAQKISPKAKDLKFDFTFQTVSICFKCSKRTICKIASLLNIPVESCNYFSKHLD